MKVLLVEDDHFSQLVAEAALRHIGVSFTSVNSAQKALELLSSGSTHFDGVLMDFRMPEMDGLEATRQIRNHSDPSLRDIPIIGLSGCKSFEDQREAMSSGMNFCIGKPVSASVLKKLLVESPELGKSRPSSTHASPSEILDTRTLRYLADETDIHVVKKVVQSFLKNLPFYVDQISQGLAQQRDDLIHRYSHILKSSSGTVGAVALFQLASELEDISSRQQVESLSDLVAKTKIASESVVIELTRYLEEVVAGEFVVSR